MGIRSGVGEVAHALWLDYTGLKKRVGGSARRQREQARPRFVELIAPRPPNLDECMIEFESAGGAKMRIQWRSAVPPDWADLLRALAAGRGMIRIAAQMRVLVAIEPVDGRKGIDSLARLCEERLAELSTSSRTMARDPG